MSGRQQVNMDDDPLEGYQTPTPRVSELTDQAFEEDRRIVQQPEKQIVEVLVEIPVPSLSIDENGYIPAVNFRITKVGLEMSKEATYDDWAKLGNALFRIEGVFQLVIGDWLNYGEHFDMTIDQIAEAVGREKKTLQNWSWVASNCSISLRRENLFYGHYSLVAGRKTGREELLQKASENSWTVADLRAYIGSLKTRKRSSSKWKQRVSASKKKIDSICKSVTNYPLENRIEMIEHLRHVISQLEKVEDD